MSEMPRRFYRHSRVIPRDFRPEEVAKIVAEDIEKFYGDEPAPLPDGVVPADEPPSAPRLREMLAEAVVQLRSVSPSGAVTTEKRINVVLNALAVYLYQQAVDRSVLREEDHGYWFTELANELRDMIEWTEFLTDEKVQEDARHARSMEWMKL